MSSPGVAVCADVGSTFTKVAAVDLSSGALVARVDRLTTAGTDVMEGLDAAVAEATRVMADQAADVSTVDVCSSAGGGLRLAVVGYEQLVTAQAGHRVGLSAGARVVHVSAGVLDDGAVADLRAAAPDVVLLVGGTDGGDDEVLRHNARRLAAARTRVPVVVAGNIDARTEVVATLEAAAIAVTSTDNVLPRIGELNPQPARAAIREVFLRHVIGGKKLSRGGRFASLVRGATPDVVLGAIELLAEHSQDDLLAIDIGGATTDVYSVLHPDPEAPATGEVAGTLWHSRTVEADLGMRWSAPGVVDAAVAERLISSAQAQPLLDAAHQRASEPDFVPVTAEQRRTDERIAQLAAIVALRRHARDQSVIAMSGGSATRGDDPRDYRKDLRRVRLVIGSGGVIRHTPPARASGIIGAGLADHAGGWPLPRAARVVIDDRYVLAPAGLLADRHPTVALRLLHDHLFS